MLSGTTLADAARIDVRGKLQCGKDVFIDINNIFSGTVIIGDNCHIAANCNLTAVTIGNNCQILIYGVNTVSRCRPLQQTSSIEKSIRVSYVQFKQGVAKFFVRLQHHKHSRAKT